ncbi:MAG: tRNA epoxyqueuosine(34) reductase QueG [Methylomonas sp.]|nr:tRNA epoxyqueuosine(34) reductase QueG [Methylomonas sp.]PPD22147.1 MAG: tRNA epoxyqueuosine(34) reductase QueG [Methylomonas sp.]PPD25506.1 MAG: tRNA epoxyqueuosine(34) reductase QueG [Methylomonas sp.]PPD36302.1 MAG: tRNA epoxyqueuosine(34) reductase QueG [Methylomonas sp.]PPD42468.1 MAG: tRNA epoxyqueuosine(34) reductase QueG [Methylomonas sp.]
MNSALYRETDKLEKAFIPPSDLERLALDIKTWGQALGFQQIGISDTDLTDAEAHLQDWLQAGMHGDMAYMATHGLKRSRPALLQPGTRSIISARMDYLPEVAQQSQAVLDDPAMAFVSRYALGRDYHKVLRNRLQLLANRIADAVGPFGYRVFTDSAPVLEKAIAEKAGLGWIGKHSNLINRKAGSWFFLGEIYTDLPLPADEAARPHCGQCRACLDICPTQAIVAPYRVDARRCVSYLTIELHGSIPEDLRPLIGNRIYGCDDCQLICPWNRFARLSAETDFRARHRLDGSTLLTLFNWSEAEFLHNTEGSAIRRIGYQRWLRNIAVALGNGPATTDVTEALAIKLKLRDASELVREHVVWALRQLQRNSAVF